MDVDWEPLGDTARPNCPYFPGFTAEIQTHNPPAPFGSSRYPPPPRDAAPDDWLRGATQTQTVLRYPPIEAAQAEPTATTLRKARLLITKIVSIGNGRGPQLVLCKVTPAEDTRGEGTFSAMAKIYDALYYPYLDRICSEPTDVCSRADQDYSREAGAYEPLRDASLTGDFAPDYYGSWTMNLAVSLGCNVQDTAKEVRPVRLILMEAIHGMSLKKMFARNGQSPNDDPDGFHYSEDYWLRVLARILDGFARQLHAGIDQNDLYPRNVVIAEEPEATDGTRTENPTPRVVLVDYNQAVVFRKSKSGLVRLQKRPLPPNPRQQWGSSPFLEWVGWVPLGWHDYENETAQAAKIAWLEDKFCGEKADLYHPIE